MKFVLASNNKGKLAEMRAILGAVGVEVLSQREAGIAVDPEETGDTFEANALIKARAAMEASGLAAIADDSGLAVEALGGAPGVYSARYGGCGSDGERWALLLKNMEKEEHRAAKFVSCIVCVCPDGRGFTVRGECPGEIARAPRGENGFGYDPVFLLPQYGKTMAELPPELKNQISHRAAAIRAAAEKLREMGIIDAEQ